MDNASQHPLAGRTQSKGVNMRRLTLNAFSQASTMFFGASISVCQMLRGCRVPSKVLFTAKHQTVFGLFRIALSKRRGEKREFFP